MELTIRFDYGHVVPWVRQGEGGLEAIAGPDALVLRTPIDTHGKEHEHSGGVHGGSRAIAFHSS